MRQIKNIDKISENDLQEIYNALVKFDNYIASVTKQPTDENIGLYEHWVDCMGDIEEIIITEK